MHCAMRDETEMEKLELKNGKFFRTTLYIANQLTSDWRHNDKIMMIKYYITSSQSLTSKLNGYTSDVPDRARPEDRTGPDRSGPGK